MGFGERFIEGSSKTEEREEEPFGFDLERSGEDCMLLVNEDKEWWNNMRKTGDIYKLISENGEWLIEKFGSEKFIAAIDKVKSNEDSTIYDIVKELEPKKGERVKLYKELREKIESSQQNLTEESEQSSTEESESNPLNEQKIIDNCLVVIDKFEELDGLKSTVVRKAKKLLPISSSLPQDFNDYIYRFDTDELKKKLEELKEGKNINDLVKEEFFANNEKRDEIDEKRDKLAIELRREIIKIVKNINKESLEDKMSWLNFQSEMEKIIKDDDEEVSGSECITKEKKQLVEDLKKIRGFYDKISSIHGYYLSHLSKY